MTVTAIYTQKTIIYGYVDVPIFPEAQNRVFSYGLQSAINADIQSVNPTSLENLQNWAVFWYLNAYVTAETVNATKFKSALPKLDYGCVDFTWRGQVSASFYWNFASQRFPTMTFWLFADIPAFPSAYIPPQPIRNGYLQALPGGNNVAFGSDYADTFSLLTNNGLLTNSRLICYYQSQLYTAPGEFASFGDI